MKPQNQLPLTIETPEDARRVFVEFKKYLEAARYAPQNKDRALNGAGQFIDFLSGGTPTKGKSYSGYPEKTQWPTD